MKLKFARIALGLTLGVSLSFAQFAAHAKLKCVADFPPESGIDKMTVEILNKETAQLTTETRPSPTSSKQTPIKQRPTTIPVVVHDENVRPALNLHTEPDTQEFSTLNLAEQSLVHIQSLLDDPYTKESVNLPFQLKNVRRIKTYDIGGESQKNKFGGILLLEPYSAGGVMLGRVLRALVVVSCN